MVLLEENYLQNCSFRTDLICCDKKTDWKRSQVGRVFDLWDISINRKIPRRPNTEDTRGRQRKQSDWQSTRVSVYTYVPRQSWTKPVMMIRTRAANLAYVNTSCTLMDHFTSSAFTAVRTTNTNTSQTRRHSEERIPLPWHTEIGTVSLLASSRCVVSLDFPSVLCQEILHVCHENFRNFLLSK